MSKVWLFYSVLLMCYLKAPKWAHASPQIVHVNLFYDIYDMMVVFVKNVFCESSSFLQKCIYSHIGCICKNVFVSTQASYKSAFVVTMVVLIKDVFCEYSIFLQKCIYSHICCICKNVLVSPQPSYKSAFEVTLVAFVKKLWVLMLRTKMHS